jgi:hypothetical protein
MQSWHPSCWVDGYLPVLTQTDFVLLLLWFFLQVTMTNERFCRQKVRRSCLPLWMDCLEHDEKLAFVFAVSTLAPQVKTWRLPQCRTLYIPPWSCLNPRTRQVLGHFGALSGKRGLVLWEIIEATFLWMSEPKAETIQRAICYHSYWCLLFVGQSGLDRWLELLYVDWKWCIYIWDLAISGIHGHRTLKAPHPVWSAQLTRVPPS